MERVNSALVNYGSVDRPKLFIELFSDNRVAGNEKVFWLTLHDNWVGFDKIPHDEFEELFRAARPGWDSSYLMPEDLAFYDSLPNSFDIYRGADENALHKVGLSWTLSRKTAEEFARGHRNILNKAPTILKSTIRKKDVAGAYAERGEQEILIFDKHSIATSNLTGPA